jgi:voltage-gated potassium channel
MTQTPSLRHRAHLLLHNPTARRVASRRVNRLLALLILSNAIAVALETVDSIYLGNEIYFKVFEVASTLIFLIEYLARIWCCVEQAAYSNPVVGRIRWALSPVALLDFVVIATYFAPVDLRFLRLARLLRLFRVLHLDSLAHTYEKLRASVRARLDLLIVSGILMVFALFSSAALLYFCEHKAQPDVFSSIPATLWWSVVTLTTVGYGDIFPVTVAGKICAGLTAVFGIGIFALPTAILTSAVIDADASARVCPHCGKSGIKAID